MKTSRVERLRHVAALDAAIGQIERALLQIEEAVIALAVLADDEARRESIAAAREAGLEADIAARVGLLGRQHFIVARDEAQRDAGKRLRSSSASGRRHADRRGSKAR